MKIRKCLFVLLCSCASLSAGDPGPESRGFDEIKESGTLRLLVYPSLEDEFLRIDLTKSPVVPVSPAEHYLGIDIDILEGFASSLGVSLEVRPAYAPGAEVPSFDQLIPCLSRGEGDLIASAFSITDDRRKDVDFSVPYYTADFVVVVPDQSPIDSEEDLVNERGAVMAGSAQEEKLREVGVRELVRMELVSTECYGLLRNGGADFCLLGLSSTEEIEEPGFKEAFRYSAVDRYAFAALPGSPLLPILDRYIEELRSNGRLQELFDRHFD